MGRNVSLILLACIFWDRGIVQLLLFLRGNFEILTRGLVYVNIYQQSRASVVGKWDICLLYFPLLPTSFLQPCQKKKGKHVSSDLVVAIPSDCSSYHKYAIHILPASGL